MHLKDVEFHEGKRPWEVKVDIALPCATQNELNGEDAQKLINNGVSVYAKVLTCHVHLKLLRLFTKTRSLFAPGKAVKCRRCCNIRTRNDPELNEAELERQEVDDRLHEIMCNIHDQCVKHGKREDGYVDYVKGANIAGFLKVANSMLDMGVFDPLGA